MRIVATLCFLLVDSQILLAFKKRGFGEGNWNGIGGKVHEGESIREAAVRELKEEIGVTALPESLDQVAKLLFHFVDGTEWEVHVFFARSWKGEPQESEEMQPRWYHLGAIPYGQMWSDDIAWLPLVLSGRKITADIYFAADGKGLKDFNWSDAQF